MDITTLGRSGLRVSRIGVDTTGWDSTMDEKTAAEILGTLVDAGGNLVTSCPAAPRHAGQVQLGQALATVNRQDLVLAVSVGVDLSQPVGRRVDCSRRAIMSALDNALARMGTDYVDVLSLGYWDPATPLDEVASTLTGLVASGKTRYVGVCDYSGWQLAATAVATGPALITATASYSLVERGPEQEVLPAAEHLGLGIIARAPLGHGLLSDAPALTTATPGTASTAAEVSAEAHALAGQRTDAIRQAARTASEGLGVSMDAVAINWVSRRPGITATVVPVTTAPVLSQLVSQLTAHAGGLPGAIEEALDDVSR
ncbi:aldo/keto reductase [Corynebacterium sp. c6VSa_13]|uniref:aldo/keto reductase n=1 Tax=Corynebacterium sp. c6VSa_13 TaxID=2913496 RepID=UPI0022BA576B|nr:aldo/keto reductase [Corynebacterium sp. c6VSa_13]